VLGSLLLLGGALWLWLGLVQAQRRQLRLLGVRAHRWGCEDHRGLPDV